MCGPCMPPSAAEEGESKFGFTARQRVEVIKDNHFQGWHGHVRTFDGKLVAVDLDEPPTGHSPNGQWFRPEDLQKAPLNVIIKDKGGYYMQFLLQHKPYPMQQVALKDNGSNLICDGVYELVSVGTPPTGFLASQFQWMVELKEVRNLRESDRPILVDKYD